MKSPDTCPTPTAASTGINEGAARAAGLDYDKIVLSPASQGGYYPGGQVMTMKVLFEKGTLKLLGEIEPGKPVYVMCQSALRSYIACRILSQNGFDCYNFSGGYRFYAAVKKDIRAKSEAWPCGMDK